jgi:hypothetical protein
MKDEAEGRNVVPECFNRASSVTIGNECWSAAGFPLAWRASAAAGKMYDVRQ